MKILLKSFILFLVSTTFFCCKPIEKHNLTKYVNPFIGTGGHGHTFPGVSASFGMIQLSPNNGQGGWDWCSGYHYSDSIVIGFSHLNLSGTGGSDLKDILFMPINKKVDLTTSFSARDAPYRSQYSHQNESATSGYYSVFLKDHNINVELTANLRTAFHKYTYKKNDLQSVVIDLETTTASHIRIENKFTVSGYRYSEGWAKNQKVFFVAKFSKPISRKQLIANGKIIDSDYVEGTKTATQLFFEEENGSTLEARVAYSSVSIENAKENLDYDKNFDEAKKKAIKNWDKELNDIVVETKVDSLKTIFYTSLYHAKLAPTTFSDVNGEFRLENDKIATNNNYTTYSTLSLWDTFRAEHPLLTLINPEKVGDMISSMLAYFDERNKLPVWNLYANETNTMTGYHSIPVIVEAYMKGIRNFDTEKAFQAIKTTMMQNERGLDHYKKYGYVPFDLLDESVTITLEYAYDDWCAAQMAKALGYKEDYNYFLNRANNAYKYVFDPETKFMRGKSSDGVSWNEPFDPYRSKHRRDTDYTEGNAWQHSWFVLHDTENFIKMHGGSDKFTDMLGQLFVQPTEITGEHTSPDISGMVGQYAHGNEPSHHIAYLFNKAGKPWLTQYWVKKILDTQYNTTPNGLSGNEDCGQMSAWYVFSSMGIYPFNPASATYEIGTPLFDKSTINLENGKQFIIEAKNVSDKNFYIQAIKLNGENYNKTFITHDQIIVGGVLTFVMGSQPNKNWGLKN
ncbi:GH92 family glycosyl hydrolase [Mariniflexile litorale]|uniref:GH92 family glycosyl hydrolase n=1 Tax=Mariniflexile litorale TaxID=3045158 RepID=A0AAU7EEH0_9FLAO|nr:GH92 family glycosyl hydrolase [Mariniflexile sp. KMM 9835]MDQ8211947.1 GH92 family glycosyl hydrolase [Mariniflexile sp. KMM 9835]